VSFAADLFDNSFVEPLAESVIATTQSVQAAAPFSSSGTIGGRTGVYSNMQKPTSRRYAAASMWATLAILTGCTGNSREATQPDSTKPAKSVSPTPPSSSASGASSGGASSSGASSSGTEPTGLTAAPELIASAVKGFGYSSETGIGVYVFGDGRVLSADPQTPWGFSEFTINARKVNEIRKLGAERSLLEGRDTGDPGITDQDFLVVNVPGPVGPIKHSIYAPGFDTGLTESQISARADITNFAAALQELPNLAPADLTTPLHAYNPTELQVNAYAVLPIDPNEEPQPQPDPVRWGATKPLATLFAQNDCIVMTGADAAWLRDEALKGSPSPTMINPVIVPSSLSSPAFVRLIVAPAETALYECQVDTFELAVTTWPALDRSIASPTDRWAALSALHEYAYEKRLGEYSSDDRLSYLTLEYAHIDHEGKTFVDLIGTDKESSTGPFEVAMRIDVTTGEVVEFQKTGVTP
jgi:hypothetical protein